jgi:HD-GYP domain-containing protein (c-di-GMP phosphodiesterase class II)
MGGEFVKLQEKFYPFKNKLGILLFTVVFLTSGFLGIFQYFMMKSTLESSFAHSQKLIRDRVENILRDADYINSLIEAPIEVEAKRVLEAVAAAYERQKNLNFDLAAFIQDKETMDLYIIDKNNRVIAATNSRDVGLDFASWPYFVSYLDSLRAKNAFSSSRMSLSLNDSNMTKYCYLPTSDGKYILETGSLIKQRNSAAKGIGFDNFEEKVVQDNPNVDSVTLFDYQGIAYKKDARGQNKRVSEENMPSFEKAIRSMEVVETAEKYGSSVRYYQYIPYQIIGAQGANERNVVEIIYNRTMLDASRRLNIQILVMAILVGAMVAASYGFYKARVITKPIERIAEGVKKVSEGNFDFSVQVDSNDEFAILGKQLNDMTLQIKKLLEERYGIEEALSKKNNEIYAQKEEISALYEETTALYEETTALNEELESLLKHNENSYFETVRALANAIEEKDSYTGGHCERVMEYSMQIAEEMKLSRHQRNDLKFGSILHDIGKIGISESILNKAAVLTAEEYELIKSHPIIGNRILENLHFLDNCRKVVFEHHEHVDGKGYPNGLCGEQIDLLARIVCVADAYDAMTSSRPYRQNAMSKEAALGELRANIGKQFDSNIVEAFASCVGK